MIDPATISLVGKALVGKHVVESVIAGNDPSLLAMSALAFPTVNPPVPKSTSPVGGEVIVATKDMGKLASTDPNVSQHVVLEQYVDPRYINHGNLEDAWGQLKNGELTFDSFVLAMVDIVDALTLGVFKPKLLEVKINPHLKAREVVYRAEVSYDTPEQTVNETVVDGVKKQEATNTQRRITQVSKISFEISPEAFQKADLSFAEGVARIKSADIADRTIIYARLDTLTEKDLKFFSENGLKEIDIQSKRLQSVETQQDLLASGERDISELTANGGTLVDDRESRLSAIRVSENGAAPNLTEEQISNAGLRVYGAPQLSADQSKTTLGQQEETIDHLKGTRDIESTVAEQIDTVQIAQDQSGKMQWIREGTRVREAAGQYDIFALKDVSIDEFVEAGSELLLDKAQVQDSIVAVDISESGETVNFVDSEKKKSWLVRESEIRHDRATSTETQTWRAATQITEFDYLANSQEILSATVQDKVIATTTVKDIIETKTHWNLFGWNSAGFLGEKIQTETTPTITTQTFVDDIELAPGQDIFSNFNVSKDTLVAQGGRIIDHSSNTNTEKLATITEKSFEEGRIAFVPFVGGIGHLASKAALGGGVTLSDAFWAAADVAEIVTTVVAIAAAVPSGGGSLGAQAAATSAKTAAKVAAKTAIKTAAKSATKTVAKAGVKTAVKTGGKAVVKGSVRIAGKSSARLASNVARKQIIRNVGERFAQYGVEEGVNSVYHAAGGKGRIPVLVGFKGGIKQVGMSSGKIAIKNGGHAGAKAITQVIPKQTGKIALKNVGHTGANAVTQTGKIAIKNGGRAGAKATAAKSGSVVRYKNIPKTNGSWLGAPGDSKWMPTAERIPSKLNPDAKSMGQILAENNMQKGIPFKQGKIDLRAASRGTVQIDNYTLSRTKNFSQADSMLAAAIRSGKVNPEIQGALKGMGVDPKTVMKGDIKALRKLGYTWHERPDMKTLDLVRSSLHANVPHSGGISALKEQLSTAKTTTGALK